MDEEQGDHPHTRASHAYLSLLSGQDIPPPRLTTDAATGSIVEPAGSSDASISHLDLTRITSPSYKSQTYLQERPVPQHTLSSASTESSATIKPSSQDAVLLEAAPLQRTLPTFPDQSYAALHEQIYPSRLPPQALRTRSSNPSPYSSYFAAASESREHIASTPSGSRTAGNSPSGSPGLFTPSGSPSRHRLEHDDGSGTYSSPYLHHTHRHVPKE